MTALKPRRMTHPAHGAARERIGAGVAVALVHLLVGLALVWGLGVPVPRLVERPLDVFDVIPPPPEPEPEPVRTPPRTTEPSPKQRQAPGREGAAAPPNLRSRATQIVAPPPIVRLPIPPPITAAPLPGTGADPSQGAAEVRGPGPGPGAGGLGDGRGSGGAGAGDGGGGGGTPPRHLRGRLSDRDYPRAALDIGAGGTVSVRFTVALNGRAVDCRIVESSGNRDLDANTCRLIERRYRFAPSRDARGRPVLADVVEDHTWVARPREGW